MADSFYSYSYSYSYYTMDILARLFYEYLDTRMIQNDMYELVCEQEQTLGVWVVLYRLRQSGECLIGVKCHDVDYICISVATPTTLLCCYECDSEREAMDALQSDLCRPEWLPYLRPEEQGQPMPAP